MRCISAVPEQTEARRSRKFQAMDRGLMISLVIPVYNEESNLPVLMGRIRPVMEKMGKPYEIILVDDGSSDNSLSILKSFATQPDIKVVELARNYGQHAAILSGFSTAKGDMIITLDADLQNPPEEIPNLVKVMEEGDYDVVGTVRRERRDTIFRTFPSKMMNVIARKITKCNMTDWGCMLRAYRRSVVERMVHCHEQSAFIPALATYFAKRVTEIEVSHEERQAGESRYSWRKLINLQFDLVSSFSDFPLKLLMYAGIGMAFLGVSFGIILGTARAVYGARWAAEGVFTLFAVLFVFVGLQFFALGVVGEYVGRIYREVRKRPEYVIERIYSSETRREIS
jgi:undecaprenyl-phosphate 4-deoxy-4-formamido-L-arabinose transferase